MLYITFFIIEHKCNVLKFFPSILRFFPILFRTIYNSLLLATWRCRSNKQRALRGALAGPFEKNREVVFWLILCHRIATPGLCMVILIYILVVNLPNGHEITRPVCQLAEAFAWLYLPVCQMATPWRHRFDHHWYKASGHTHAHIHTHTHTRAHALTHARTHACMLINVGGSPTGP